MLSLERAAGLILSSTAALLDPGTDSYCKSNPKNPLGSGKWQSALPSLTPSPLRAAGGVEGDFHVHGVVAVGTEELVVDLVAEFEG